jgi:heme-degrading monooxygenase HmoA
MIVQIDRHDVRPERFDEARARIIRLGEIMMRQPGFLFRHVGCETARSTCITTLTGWQDAPSFDAWEDMRKAAPPRKVPASELYTHVEIIRVETFS